jgi:carbamoyl-phosphate synthase small subunit
VIRDLQKKYPLFAICMGHQLFALANGADTEKLKFGHRGANHPVKDLKLGKVFMSSQNHGYTVTVESVKTSDLEINQININDNTCEGLEHKTLPAFSVQYHPEACPGPEDTAWLFDKFINSIRN